MTYRMQRALEVRHGRGSLPSWALGLLTLVNLSCGGSNFEASGGAGSGGTPGSSGRSGTTNGGANSGAGAGAGGVANAAGAPSGGGGAGAAGGATGGTGGATPQGGSGGIATGASGGGGAGGTGGAPACGDVQLSDANCGACGYACVNGRHCAAGRCSPAWQALSTDNAPTPRTAHAAGFVGTKYVVLGGSLIVQGSAVSTSAAYDVSSNAWTHLAPLNGARCAHQAVSTGDAILTFGGLTDCGNGTTIGPGLERFTLSNNTAGMWSTINAANAPPNRYAFAATWTGNSLFVYGGGTNTQPAVASGALFSPSGSTWSDASCALSGCERGGIYSTFRDGDVVRVWGGGPFGSAPAGLIYDLIGQSWSAWTVPEGTAEHLAERFADDGRRIYFLKGMDVVTVYDRRTSSWLANDTAAMPSGFCNEGAAAWTGSELVAWSGSCGGAPVSVGGRYQPAAPN
jgi:hypothetical protein